MSSSGDTSRESPHRAVDIMLNLLILYAVHLNLASPNDLRSKFIILCLEVMAETIYLYDQTHFVAIKICDEEDIAIGAFEKYWILTAELVAKEFSVSNSLPKQLLTLRRSFPQITAELLCSFDNISPHPASQE